MDAAYHLAGAGHVASVSGAAAEAAAMTNVHGTRNFVEACGRDGVGRLIHFSSTAAMGLVRCGKIDEKTPCRPVTPYQKSKLESEYAAGKAALAFDMDLVILRPCMVYGEGGKGEFLKFCRLIQKGLFPRIGLGQNLTPIVHVSDVAAAAVNALTLGKPGIYLIASDKSYPMKELFQYICEGLGVRRMYFYVPVWAAVCIAFLLERVSGISGREPVVSRSNIISSATGRAFDISKAGRDLAFAPRTDTRLRIKETIDWFREQGLIQ
jgi:nucleoside-diphosphate-sugar epimerase